MCRSSGGHYFNSNNFLHNIQYFWGSAVTMHASQIHKFAMPVLILHYLILTCTHNCSQSIAVNFWCQGLWTHTSMPLSIVQLVLAITSHSLNGSLHILFTLRLHSEMQHLRGNSQWNLWYEHFHIRFQCCLYQFVPVKYCPNKEVLWRITS